jgi:hypothetical protein
MEIQHRSVVDILIGLREPRSKFSFKDPGKINEHNDPPGRHPLFASIADFGQINKTMNFPQFIVGQSPSGRGASVRRSMAEVGELEGGAEGQRPWR